MRVSVKGLQGGHGGPIRGLIVSLSARHAPKISISNQGSFSNILPSGAKTSLTERIVSEGLVRYEVVATCVQVSEESKKICTLLADKRFLTPALC